MNDKVKLLELANEKIASNSDFMAFYLKRYSEIEKISKKQIRSDLNCSTEDFYKLGLCKAPTVSTQDFVSRINKIGEYSGIAVLELSKIINRVNSVIKLSGGGNNGYLMAARDKNNTSEDNSDANEDS